jgi:C1A family cysteine protease
MPRTTRRLGWIPDLPDRRDIFYSAPAKALLSLPPRVDLRNACPPVYDQGEVGSCTGNAIGAAIQFDRLKNKQAPDFVPSRLFIYYNERVVEGTVKSDAGAMIRDGIKSTVHAGVCPETLWPYHGEPTPDNGGNNTAVFKKPPAKCYKEAGKHQVVSYMRVLQNSAQLRGCLSVGYPFVFGFTVYDSFYSTDVTKTGKVPMPKDGESVQGGHAVLAVGYDDAAQVFIVRNSWGEKWGDKGYFYMPYAYLLDHTLSSDIWTIRTIEA